MESEYKFIVLKVTDNDEGPSLSEPFCLCKTEAEADKIADKSTGTSLEWFTVESVDNVVLCKGCGREAWDMGAYIKCPNPDCHINTYSKEVKA